jgi:hypothetical protein
MFISDNSQVEKMADIKCVITSELEAKKQSLVRILEDYNRQVTSLGITLDSYFIRYEQEGKRLANLHAKRLKEENIIRRLENNKAEIRKIAEEKVRILLSNRRHLIKLAALSIIESIRGNPEKYRNLVNEREPSVFDYATSEVNSFWMFGESYLQPRPQQSQYQSKVHFIEDYVDILTKDADVLLEEIVKMLGVEIINDYTVIKSQQPSLPLFSSNIEQDY